MLGAAVYGLSLYVSGEVKAEVSQLKTWMKSLKAVK